MGNTTKNHEEEKKSPTCDRNTIESHKLNPLLDNQISDDHQPVQSTSIVIFYDLSLNSNSNSVCFTALFHQREHVHQLMTQIVIFSIIK